MMSRWIKKKAMMLLLIILIILVPFEGLKAHENIEELEIEELEHFLKEFDLELKESIPELNLSQVFQNLKKGQLDLNLKTLLEKAVNYLFREFLFNSHILAQLMVLALFSAILQNLTSAFEGATISKLANLVIFLAIITIALYSFNQIIQTGTEAIEKMMDFIYALLPILLSLVAAVGGFGTAAIIHPLVLAGISLLSNLIVSIVFPLIYLAAILVIANNISEQFQIASLAKLIKEISLGILGFFLTIFVGILSLQGVASAMADGIGLRTAKFLTGSFVPVVGKVFSDALETVVGTTLLLKNAVSLIGAVVVIVICILPAIKIISMILIYRLAAALIQPFGEKKIGKILEDLASILLVVFGAVASVGLMFFMVIGITAGLGNFTVLLR